MCLNPSWGCSQGRAIFPLRANLTKLANDLKSFCNSFNTLGFINELSVYGNTPMAQITTVISIMTLFGGEGEG